MWVPSAANPIEAGGIFFSRQTLMRIHCDADATTMISQFKVLFHLLPFDRYSRVVLRFQFWRVRGVLWGTNRKPTYDFPISLNAKMHLSEYPNHYAIMASFAAVRLGYDDSWLYGLAARLPSGNN